MREIADKPAEEVIPALLKEIKETLNHTVEELKQATPMQTVELAGALITALAHASHRKQSKATTDAVHGALRHLIRQVQADIEDTDPGDCVAIAKACRAIEFQGVVSTALKAKG